MKKSVIAAVVLTVIVAAGSILYWQYTKTPKYSLWQAKKAIDQHDLASFEKYVDVEGICSRAIDQLLETISDTERPKDQWEQLGQSIGKGLVTVLKPQLTKIVKQEISDLIEKGESEIKKNKAESKKSTFSLSNFLNKTKDMKNSFEHIEYVKKEGKIAYVRLKFHLDKQGAPLVINLKMRNLGNYWQVANITNFFEILEKLDFTSESFPLSKRLLSKEQAFDMGNKRLSFKGLNGSFLDSQKAGKLFVVKGLVINNYPDKRSFIRIRSNILSSKGTVVKSKIVYAGNPIGDKELQSLAIEEINNRLRNKFGKSNMNINILSKSSIPFMVIFSELPEDICEFTVEAISSSPGAISTKGEMIDRKKEKQTSLSVYWIKTNSANVRSGPSTNNSIISTLKRGDKVYFINQQGKWYKIMLGKEKENIGWMHSSLLSKSFVKPYQEKMAYLDKVVTSVMSTFQCRIKPK